MKIAIIGAGLGGLACALECERLGVIPDVFERDESVGWDLHVSSTGYTPFTDPKATFMIT